MGCASGRFIPTPAYALIQQYCAEHFDNWVPPASLTVSLPDGTPIECSGGIQIEDPGADFGEGLVQISICGVHSPPYAELFPQHMEAHHKNQTR